jgi:hypothetical protein
MFDKANLDELSRRLAGAVPPGISALGGDLERTFRGILQGAVDKLNLVSREEFEVQSQVLARTRAKLEALEAQLAELETRIAQK